MRVGEPGPDARQIERALARVLHVDDLERLKVFRDFLSGDSPPAPDGDDPHQRMLFTLLGYMRKPLTHLGEAWRAVWQNPDLREELIQLFELLEERVRTVPVPLRGVDGRALPLFVHATYSRDEVMAALNVQSAKGGFVRSQGGVHFLEAHQTECCFVELDKLERDYTPATMYNDYPISTRQFHWESQSACHPRTPAGRRYLAARPGADVQVVLFVRHRKKDPRGVTMPYLCLGRVFYGGHEGGRPMGITWELEREMPAGFYQEAKMVGG